MVSRNKNIAKLQGGYFSYQMAERKKKFTETNPDAKIISLGIGDTTQPLTPHIVAGLKEGVDRLSKQDTYSGYGLEAGTQKLREAISQSMYNGSIAADEIFVSDGAKPDTGRLQVLFGADATVALQNPAYPVYVDGSVIMGQTGDYSEESGQFNNVVYMNCLPENNFFPDLENTPRTDLIYFCSPNNPTGAVATKEQLQQLVDFAKKNKSIIIFDAAYAQFIRDSDLPTSIYDIDGAREVAIEVNSFSKCIGFAGVRLGWTIVPKELTFDDGTAVHADWQRIVTTVFNGASNLVQHGALASLDETGRQEMKETVDYYMENAAMIKNALDTLGYTTYGGNAPYIWTKIEGKDSWQAFDEILEKAHIICTPGVAFGSAGQGFVRFSAFAQRADVEEAIRRLEAMQ